MAALHELERPVWNVFRAGPVGQHQWQYPEKAGATSWHREPGIDDFIGATASGQASEKRRRLDELISVLQRGDRLVVSELSRLGRSLGQIVAILDALTKEGVAFVALKENIRVEGKRDIQTKVMTTLFALFAEVERDLISGRTREGLAKARSSGRKLGRPKGSLGVSRPTLHTFMSTRGLRPNP